MINDKISKTYGYYDETSIDPASYPGWRIIEMHYGKTRRAELSIGADKLRFNKFKVLTNQKKFDVYKMEQWYSTTKIDFFNN